MTIANVSELNATLSKLGLYGSATQPGSTGSLAANLSSLPTSSSQGGGLASMIMQALAQIGVSGTQSSLGTTATNSSSAASGAGSSTASTQNSSQALKSFMQSLFAALQAQAAASANHQGSSTASSGTSNASGHSHGHGHRHGGGGLQSLIQQLSASSSSSASGSPGSTSSATSTAASAPLTSLQQSFNTLVSTVGGSGSKASLSNFLTTLAGDLSAGAHTGNLVSTQA